MAGVVAALSVTSDLTRGHPPGEAMRACLLATELAKRAGLGRAGQSDVHYGTLMRFVGCAATSHEVAAALGGVPGLELARLNVRVAAMPELAQRVRARNARLDRWRALEFPRMHPAACALL
jgi:hypothetical protein